MLYKICFVIGSRANYSSIKSVMTAVKSDKKLSKKMETMDEQNIDIVATASKLRKEYETLYRQIRKLVYPKKGDDLR